MHILSVGFSLDLRIVVVAFVILLAQFSKFWLMFLMVDIVILKNINKRAGEDV